MKYVLLLLITAISFTACHHEEAVKAPPTPKSITDVTSAVKGKHYKVEKLGLLSAFEMDSLNPVNWNIQKEDTSKFFRDYADKQLAFKLDFSNDSAASFTDEGKMIRAVYATDNDPSFGYEEEKPGIKLRLKYSDSLELGADKSAAVMTQSYLVRGVDDKSLLLETKKSINNHALVVWLKAE